MQSVIILFAKAPVVGCVKTRLQPPLTAGEAASLHIAFVNDMLQALQQSGRFALELHTDIATDVWTPFGVTERLQQGADLGLKMIHSLTTALESGAPRAMIVGTDAPTLPLEYLYELLAADADVALGPTDDGGYYAIAARRVHPAMFDTVTWSHPTALQCTLDACARSGLTTFVGRRWFDIDEAADLDRLIKSSNLPPHTTAWIHKHRYPMGYGIERRQ